MRVGSRFKQLLFILPRGENRTVNQDDENGEREKRNLQSGCVTAAKKEKKGRERKNNHENRVLIRRRSKECRRKKLKNIVFFSKFPIFTVLDLFYVLFVP